MNARKPYALTLGDLRCYCGLLSSIEVLGTGDAEQLVGKNAAGEIVVRVKGKVTPATVNKFRYEYGRAVAAGIIKPKENNGKDNV